MSDFQQSKFLKTAEVMKRLRIRSRSTLHGLKDVLPKPIHPFGPGSHPLWLASEIEAFEAKVIEAREARQ